MSRIVRMLMAATLAAPVAAAAQEPPPADTAARDTAAVLVHEGITVRALRAPLSLEALPFAVTVRAAGEAPAGAGLTLAEALRAVPGLQVQSRYNDALGERIVVRGFGARAQFGVRGVHVIVDGVPATMPDGQTTLNHVDLAFLHRAEVLRGPAAAAYGNAAGGVLLLSTTPPPAAAFHARASSLAGSDGLLRLRATSGGGRDGTGWIASVSREWRDGYRPHSGTDRWQLTGRADAPVAGGHLRMVAHGVSYDADNPGSLTPEQYLADPHQAQAFNVLRRTGEDGRHAQVGLTWERALDNTFLEFTAYGVARTLENPIPPSIIELDRRAGGIRTLLRGGGRNGVAWAAGVDAALLGDDRRNYENADGVRGALTLDQAETVANVAAHGQALLPLGSRVGLFLAARYDRVSFAADDFLISPDDPDDSGSRTMDALSPTAGVRLSAAEGLDLFANVSTAFETPTTTELVNRPDGAGGFNPSLEPQRTVSFEAGARAAPGPGLRLEASAYHALVDDALVPFEVESAPGRQYFRNAGGARHRGVELLVELRTPAIDLLGTLDRTAAEFTAYETPEASYDGHMVPGVRPWTGELDVSWRTGGVLALGLGYQAAGEMFVNDANTTEAPGYHLFGIRATAPVTLGDWTVRVHSGIDNLLDETYVASVVPNAFGGRFYEPGPGRSFHIGVELGAGTPR